MLPILGFILSDSSELVRDLRRGVVHGSIVVAEDVLDGLENATFGLVGLLAGDNFGNSVVRVAKR